MDNLKKKPFEVPTLTAYGTLSELTQNSFATGTAMPGPGVITSSMTLTNLGSFQ